MGLVVYCFSNIDYLYTVNQPLIQMLIQADAL